MKKFGAVLVLGLALLPVGALGETYKCRAADGKITYAGQMSLTPGVTCEQMFVRKQSIVVQDPPPAAPIEAGTAPMADPRMPPPPDDVPVAQAPPADGAKKPEVKNKNQVDEAKKKAEKSASDKQAEQKLKEDNCKSAQANLRTYQAGGRIGKVNEAGEKVYLDDAEVKQRLEQAQKDADKWCGS